MLRIFDGKRYENLLKVSCKALACHRFRRYETLENKTPTETFPKFPSILHVINTSDQNPPIKATNVTF